MVGQKAIQKSSGNQGLNFSALENSRGFCTTCCYIWKLWLKCLRGLGSTSLRRSAFELVCATIPGCCTFLVEKVLLLSLSCPAPESCPFVGAEGQDLTEEVDLKVAVTVANRGLNFAWASLLTYCLGWKLHMEGKRAISRRRCFHPHTDARSAWPIISFCLRWTQSLTTNRQHPWVWSIWGPLQLVPFMNIIVSFVFSPLIFLSE